jgi:hypothetical protein
MTMKRLKTDIDCLRALNRLFNEVDRNEISKDKAHTKRLVILACWDVIKGRAVMEELKKKQEEEEDYSEYY